MESLLELSWQSQVVVVGGYFSYALAYAGRRAAHKAMDTLAITLCFGGVGLYSMHLASAIVSRCQTAISESVLPLLLSIIGILMPLLVAVCWRGFMREWMVAFSRRLSGSIEDGLGTAWSSIIQHEKAPYSQLIVTLKDGTMYESSPLHKFEKMPNGPCVLGEDGAVGMYVTDITTYWGATRSTQELIGEGGIRMTYIPASQIKEIDIRREYLKR
jgi:hypothetical protein